MPTHDDPVLIPLAYLSSHYAEKQQKAEESGFGGVLGCILFLVGAVIIVGPLFVLLVYSIKITFYGGH